MAKLFTALVLVLLIHVVVSQTGKTFISIGDWGGAALEEGQYAENTDIVATQLGKSAEALNAEFIISTGDNFYWCGIQNSSDYQVKVSWVDPYKAASLQVPWYVSLGNHEYGYNVDAQLELANIYDNWVLPGRYYTKRVEITSGVYVTFIVIDSSPCVAEYRSSNPRGWDPCGEYYPTCSIVGGSDPFEGPCKFHENIIAQDCGAQLTWFKEQLAAAPAGDWLIVIGHHPLDELNVEDFVTPLQDNGFDLYLNGHAHTLTQYSINNNPAFVTTGAGACVNAYGDTPPQEGGSPAKDITVARANGQDASASLLHSYKTLWNQKVAGFTSHTFSTDYTQLTTNYIDAKGNIVHSFSVTKGSR